MPTTTFKNFMKKFLTKYSIILINNTIYWGIILKNFFQPSIFKKNIPEISKKS
jgi:hypothetical protein